MCGLRPSDERHYKERQKYMVDIAKLERIVDSSFEHINNLSSFIDTFKNRYPNEYQNIVKEHAQHDIIGSSRVA